MTNSTGQSRLTGERFVRRARWFMPIVVIAAVVSGIASYGVSRSIAPEYRATAQLFLAPASNPTAGLADIVLGQTLARSYVQLATADVVMKPAMDQVGWQGDVESFRERTTIAQIRDTSVISVTFQTTDPERAANAANAVSESFIAQSKLLQSELQGPTSSELDQQIRSIGEDIRQLDAQIASLRTQLSSVPQPGTTSAPKADLNLELSQAGTQRQSKQTTLAQLLKTRDDLRLSAARADATVSLWQRAPTPASADFPHVGLNTLLGAVTGALITVVVILVVNYLEDRMRDAEEMADALGVTVLSEVQLASRPTTQLGKLFMRDEPTSQTAESFRALRTNISFADVDHHPSTLLVTSALLGEGKSFVSSNLALAFAEAGKNTILIDADLRRPSQHRLFRVSAASGLTSLLTDMLPVSALNQFHVTTNLIVIPSGPLPPNPAQLLASAKMSALVAQLHAQAPGSLVIIDSSPVLAVADAVGLAAKVDGCIVVVDSSRTHARSAQAALEALVRVHAVVVGAVLNKTSGRFATYYDYSYQSDARAASQLKRANWHSVACLVSPSSPQPVLGAPCVGLTLFDAR